MKIAFIFMGAENLGVEYLSAAAKAAGHETRLFFDAAPFSGKLMLDSPMLAKLTDARPKILSGIKSWKPDAVAFSCFTGNYIWSLDVARKIKESLPSAKILFGGVHVTSVPDIVIAEDCVDAILKGEGDTVFTSLAESATSPASKSPVPGAVIKDGTALISSDPHPPLSDLDSLPMPDKLLFYDLVPSLERHYMIMAARGCPYSCTYCYKSLDDSSSTGAPSVRKRSVDNVIEELSRFKSRGIMEMVVFRDDVFGVNIKWLEEFAQKYPKAIGLPYFCYTHPDAVDADRAELLSASGCTFTTMGIQSADESIRKKLLNRNYSNERAIESVRILKNKGIRVSLDHIAGLPDEKPEDLEKAALFYATMKPDRLLTFRLEYLPGTKIMESAVQRGIISYEQADMINRGNTGYRYSGSNPGPRMPLNEKAVNFMNFVTMLPPSVTAWLVQKRLYRLLPGSAVIQQFLMAVNAVKIRDPFFMYNIKFLLSRKKVF